MSALLVATYCGTAGAWWYPLGRWVFTTEQSKYPSIAAKNWKSDFGISFFAGLLMAVGWPITLTVFGVARLLDRLDPNTKEKSNGSDRKAAKGASNHSSGGAFDLTWQQAFGGSSLASTYGAAVGADPRVEEPKDQIEEVESDLPILAHRVAGITFAGSKPFGSISNGGTFGLDEKAICRKVHYSFTRYEYHHTSPAPALECECGFYAVPSDVEPFAEALTYVTLMVELSGTVIEHEKGYRAERQRVVECQLPACPFCARQADCVITVDHNMTSVACADHVPTALPEGAVVVAVADVERRIGMPLTRLGEPVEKGEAA